VSFDDYGLRKVSVVTGLATGIQAGHRTEMSGWMQQDAGSAGLDRSADGERT